MHGLYQNICRIAANFASDLFRSMFTLGARPTHDLGGTAN